MLTLISLIALINKILASCDLYVFWQVIAPLLEYVTTTVKAIGQEATVTKLALEGCVVTFL